MDASMLNFNSADPAAWRDRMLQGAAPLAEKLQAATRQFEAMLLKQYLDEALKPLVEGADSFGGGNPVYGYLITDALASGLSQGGTFGFGNLLQAQIAGKQKLEDATSHENIP